MLLNDFFECNSISLDVIEVFDDFCSEKSKKAALNAVRRELYDEYASEPDSEIVFLMTLYWCGLKNGIIDEKSKSKLEALNRDNIFEVYGEDDAETIYTVLQELLQKVPAKPERKKIDYSNPGSKNWKVGDLYSYPLSGEKIEQAGIAGKYAIVYCFNTRKYTTKKNYVETYVFLGDEDTIKKSPDEILNSAELLISFPEPKSNGLKFKFLLVSCHHEYPTNKLTFLGNSKKFIHPQYEIVPATELHIPRLLWECFEDIVLLGLSWKNKYIRYFKN